MRGFLKKIPSHPGVLGLASMIAYFVLTLPILVRHGFDPSVFIVAGDQFVDAAKLVSPIIVKVHSAGYDGQFYYRIALSPFHLQPDAYGVEFDNPAWRVQRIMYPVLAWIAALGRAQLVPASLFVVNLIAIGAVALFAARLTRRLSLPAFTPVAVMLWPGFIFSLTHDTTEIVAAAFILAALDAYFAERLILFAILSAAATLTRETSVLFVVGVLWFEAGSAVRSGRDIGRWRRTLIVGCALVPFLLWHEVQFTFMAQPPPVDAVRQVVYWPFLGFAEAITHAMAGVGPFGKFLLSRVFLAASLVLVALFSAMVLVRLPAVLRSTKQGALGAGWMTMMALMALMSAGTWTDYFRVFTECFVVGCLVIATRPPRDFVVKTMLAVCTVGCVGTLAISFHTLL